MTRRSLRELITTDRSIMWWLVILAGSLFGLVGALRDRAWGLAVVAGALVVFSIYMLLRLIRAARADEARR